MFSHVLYVCEIAREHKNEQNRRIERPKNDGKKMDL
jgi:hypothetical protein